MAREQRQGKNRRQDVEWILDDPGFYPDNFKAWIPRTVSQSQLLDLSSDQLPAIEPIRLVGGPGNPAFLNSWVNYGSGYADASFYKDLGGRVHLAGLIKSGANTTIAFILPEGYRPTGILIFPMVISGPSVGGVVISTAGEVSLTFSGSPTFMSLNGISFRKV